MTDQTTKAIAAEVRGVAARKLVRNAELARALGITSMSMSRRMRGETSFSGEELHKLAGVLEVPVDSFFPEANVRTGTGG